MSDANRAIVPLGQRVIVASVNRQFAITEKLVGSIQTAQNLFDVFNVPLDGSFEEAIDKIRPNGLITIAAGRYILEAGVTITKPLRIKGAGRNESIIESSVAGTILCVETDGLFELEHIGIVRTGEQRGDLLSITTSKVHVNSCALVGPGITLIGGGHWFKGIRLAGKTIGIVNDTTVACCLTGIGIEGNAEINVHDSHFKENISGISFSDHAIGTAENNICSRNIGSGIIVRGISEVLLIGNSCKENANYGIFFQPSATGTAKNNICSQNKYTGIYVRAHSTVHLIGNRCEENGSAGISFSEPASGIVEKNICRLNKKKGISIKQVNPSTVFLNNNVCEGNGEWNMNKELADVGIGF